MTILEFKQILEQSGLPVFYSEAPKGASLGYIVYRLERSPLLVADDSAYVLKGRGTVEVYEQTKANLDNACIPMEEAFKANSIVWYSDESNDIDESFFLNYYTLEV